MNRRVLAVVGFVLALFVGFLARGVLLSVGRIVLVALLLALVAGFVLVVTRQPAYRRTKVGSGARVIRRPLNEDVENDERQYRCAECETPVDEGERRRFVREWVLFGVPVLLLDDGENVYCSTCTENITETVLEQKSTDKIRET